MKISSADQSNIKAFPGVDDDRIFSPNQRQDALKDKRINYARKILLRTPCLKSGILPSKKLVTLQTNTASFYRSITKRILTSKQDVFSTVSRQICLSSGCKMYEYVPTHDLDLYTNDTGNAVSNKQFLHCGTIQPTPTYVEVQSRNLDTQLHKNKPYPSRMVPLSPCMPMAVYVQYANHLYNRRQTRQISSPSRHIHKKSHYISAIGGWTWACTISTPTKISQGINAII